MNAEVPSQARFDVYRAVTESIITSIENGAGEFVMPWHGSGIEKPQNAHTKMEYHGINVIALWAQAYLAGFKSGYWATYRQWHLAGAQVKQGAKGSTVVFFKRVEEEMQADETEPSIRLFARASRVFNADQVAGWEPPRPRYERGSAEALESVETFVAASKAVVHDGGTMARYYVPDDYIEMPDRWRFTGSPTSSATEAYSATLLHELVHWTGAKPRLDRGFEAEFNKETLASEELVAEIGAAYLCADLGVANEPRPDHAAYVESWLKALRNDTRAIFKAARLADRAANYLHEFVSASDW